MGLDLEQLKEARRGLNELISQRWKYISSSITSEGEVGNTKQNLTLTYSTLGKVLELIGKEEVKEKLSK